MAHTFEELRHLTVAQMRELASGIEHDALQGHSQMRKEDLLQALCSALGLEMHMHHDVVGIDKAAIKAKIRDFKKLRDAALEAHDHAELKKVRRRIHHLKHRIRRATV